MKRVLASQRGDTLIEVTLALAILAMVLLTSTLVTTRAFRLGQTARERTIVADTAQVQAEALRSFRDNHTWAEFLNGGTRGGVNFSGVLNSNASSPVACKASASCFHLEPKPFGVGASEFVPAGGSANGPVPTSFTEITVTPSAGAPPTSVDVTISYGFNELGGAVKNAGHIKTTLTNIGLKP